MIIAANFKTNLTRSQTTKYVNELNNCISNSNQEVLLFPATSSLNSFDSKVTIGAQNAYPTNDGAFTGEIGLVHLQEFNIKTILIGHSERRHILGETQDQISKKFNFYKELGFKIVYCVGEKLEQREQGIEATLKYIQNQFNGIDLNYENLIIAYEPVWAIGTGLIPTLKDIELIHTKLKESSSAPLLYGGSVKVDNAQDILKTKNVDGILVGSGALDVNNFCKMIDFADKIQK